MLSIFSFGINIILIDMTLTIRHQESQNVYGFRDFEIYIGENFLL